MSTKRFEGSFLGDVTRLPPGAILECKICWHVYDPALGCDVWQISPGTPFAALPDHWRCPTCDGDREQFMVIEGTGAPALDVGPPQDRRLEALIAEAPGRFEAAFREIYARQMRGVPISNDKLAVKAVGFRAHEGRVLGALVTPWFMNIVLGPSPDEDWSGLIPGAKELIEFPSGRYEFVSANRPETGPYKACSLFSPMFEFATMLHATETAAAALVALSDPSIREDGDRSQEIRRRREDAAAEPRPGANPAPTRRAVIFGSDPLTQKTAPAPDAS